MTATAILSELAASGIRVEVRGDRLHVEAPPGAVTSELRSMLAAHKAAIIAALSAAIDPADVAGLRAHLLALAADSGIPAAVVYALPADDVAACCDLDDGILRWWLGVRREVTPYGAYRFVPRTRV